MVPYANFDFRSRFLYNQKEFLRFLKIMFTFFSRYLEKSHWIISDEDENGDACDQNSEITPTVPALKSDISYENESCPICR